MTSTDNPLLTLTGLPDFERIEPAHVLPAINRLVQQFEASLEEVVRAEFPADWHAISTVLGVASERLARAWGVVSHLNSVADSPAFRKAYNAALPIVTECRSRRDSDQRLYLKYKQIDAHWLAPAQRRALNLALRDFVLSGAELHEVGKARLLQIQERLAALSQKFGENVLDATDAYAYYARAPEVRGLPTDLLSRAANAAQADGRPGCYKLTLHMPDYLPVQQYAEDRGLRERLFEAYATRASDLAPDELRHFDNSPLIDEILALRQERAVLLGFTDFSELSLARKMADSPAQVIEFLHDLARRARPHAERDVADLRAFARAKLGLDDPQPWDWAYISESLKQDRYSFSDHEVRAYFPVPKVLQGLFEIAERLFDVRIFLSHASGWHPAVEFYRVERKGRLLGQFYLDLSARPGKRGGAWMSAARGRWLRPDDGQLQTPVSYLVCNFASGSDGEPALLTHRDVVTLFHEFGHGLHHLLTQVDEIEVSGIHGVEWDAIELPSQLMENFCWEWPVLQAMTKHVETGKPLPRNLYERMIAARNFQSGLQTVRQIEFGLFDLLAHSAKQPDVLRVLREVRDSVSVLPAASYLRLPQAFSHIFAGSYAAGYYSYKWAEVLSADAYSAFEEESAGAGSAAIQTGQRYLRTILESGGSRPGMDSFRAFRGREPQIDALLRHQGM